MNQRPQLPADLITRIRAIAAQLREVDPKTEDEWIEGFALDWRPEQEIATWEVMALTYTSFTQGRQLSKDAKMEVLKIALSKSLGRSDDNVRSTLPSALSDQDRREVLVHFAASARTLGFIDGCGNV